VYSLDNEDLRLLDALRTVSNVNVSYDWNSALSEEQRARFIAAKLNDLQQRMNTLYTTFCSPSLFNGVLSDSKMRIQVGTKWCEVTWSMMDSLGLLGVSYTAKYGDGKLYTCTTVEKLLGIVLYFMKRRELGFYFRDTQAVVRIAGDPVTRYDSPDVSGPDLHDPVYTSLRPGGPQFTGPTETLHREWGPVQSRVLLESPSSCLSSSSSFF